MHLAHLRLRDFRNYARLDQDFEPGFHVLLGDNGQGKTNLLEAIYLMATLRSFRGVGGNHMIRQGRPAYFVGGQVQSEFQREIRMYWSNKERQLTLNGDPVRRMSEYLGVLRTVIFCTEDLQLVKGPPAIRRRFMDLLLAQTQPGYLAWLQRHMKVLRARNALLKRRPLDPLALEGFTRELVRTGKHIMQARASLVPILQPLAAAAYNSISGGRETLHLEYRPSVKGDLQVEIQQSRERELAQRTTVIGPHRDELQLRLADRSAAQFASEGQKRSAAVSLKMAQAELLAQTHGIPPILLIDDVMGELDIHRRAGLIPLLERTHHARGQVFMTCTEENWPRELGRRITRWEVQEGALRPLHA